MWNWRARLQAVKEAVVREVVPNPDEIPPEFSNVVSAFPFSYASGRTIIDICRERGIEPSNGRVLIVGAFGGRDYHWLRGHGYAPLILDLERHAWADQCFEGDAASAEVWERAGGDYDLIIMCDVLEHIPNDFAVLQHARDALREGGCLFISVPFHHDVEDTHLRAYTLATLTRLLAAAGLEVTRMWPRPGMLELWPRLMSALHYGVGIAAPRPALAGKLLAWMLDVEYRVNDLTRPAARALIGHMQQGAHLLCVPAEARDHLAANQSVFCD